MYQFSRAIYRRLSPEILPPPPGSPPASNHAAVLRACEEVVTRMALDRQYFARPERTSSARSAVTSPWPPRPTCTT